MRKIQLNAAKLQLNKEKITDLKNQESAMNEIRGGYAVSNNRTCAQPPAATVVQQICMSIDIYGSPSTCIN